MDTDQEPDDFLHSPRQEEYATVDRTQSHYNPLHTFALEKVKQYQQQYGDMYFLRLARLKPAVEEIAAAAWATVKLGDEAVRRVDRVLDVRQGELSWVAGTVYLDMPLKPNILDDISKDHWISAPPPREKYLSPTGNDQIMLEDESGRLRLMGTTLSSELLVTGCIIAVMGTENANGDFEVMDIKLPELPRQPQRWERDDSATITDGQKTTQTRREDGKVALVSGLGISGDQANNLSLELLMEFLTGEAGSTKSQMSSANINRLIIAGNSIAEATPLPAQEEIVSKKSIKKYGYDAAAYNPAPTAQFDAFLSTILPSIPVTLLPGDGDPANVSLPQQPLHPALFPHSRAYAAPPVNAEQQEPGWMDSVSNPWDGDIQGWRMLGTGGQPVDDVFKYVEGDDRLEMMERLLRWRCCAPTAPDTLWCYPFQTHDPFILTECPHVFFVGNQPRFETTVIRGELGERVRLIALPKFKETGEIVLLDLETLEVEVVKFEVPAS
ncbi:MAG: hypothetical protein M1833_002286 [Piccolia ochrophora]|nr:MAG: hypothetical protein M1833_002286 [Piccolia ochrophora]